MTSCWLRAAVRAYGLPRDRHVQNGPRPEGGRKRRITGTWASQPARGRCVDHADDDFRQHQRSGDNDRRKGRRHGQGYRFPTGASRIGRSRSRVIELGGSGLPGCAIRIAKGRSRRPSCCSRDRSDADRRRNRRWATSASDARGRAGPGRNQRPHRRPRRRGSSH